MKESLFFCLLIAAGSLITNGQTRDPFLWPFSVESVWNMPIHEDAWLEGNHEDANIDGVGAPSRFKGEGVQLFIEDTLDPRQEYHRVKWTKRCTDHNHYKDNYLHFPDSYTWNGEENSQKNSAFALIKPDRETIWDGTLFTRCEEGGWIGGAWFAPDKPYRLSGPGAGDPISDPDNFDEVDIWGHGASRMSALGGTIRKGELTSPEDEPIRHALKFTIYAKRYLANCELFGGTPFIWPAQGADGYACNKGSDNHYQGNNINFVMGSLLALPPDITKEDLGIETLAGRKIFDALQTYGGYPVEDAAWDNWQFFVEEEAIKTDWPTGDHISITSGQFFEELRAMIGELHIIKLNTPDSIAGGPTSDHENRMAPVACGLGEFGSGNDCDDSATGELRDPYKWPFSKTSIWNMPIGSGAEYYPQPVNPDHIDGVMVDADIIVMTPDEDLMPVYGTEYRWSSETNQTTRCIRYNDKVHIRLPIPDDYVTHFYGTRPNNPGVILTTDGRTLVQTQPFQTCGGGYATTGIRYSNPNDILRSDDVDILSEGIEGMHGGSGLSSLGGAIRVGELAPGSDPIRHALKISFPGEHYLYFNHDIDKGYRWPARKHDSNAENKYNGDNPEALQGCLRAIPANVDLELLGLETEPGKKIAWTLQNYGAYQVEGVPWARMMIAVEEGPAGDVAKEFKEDWGYDMVTQDKEGNPWFRDMIKIMKELHIVSNNGPESIGGAGEPLQPLAPDFIPFKKLTIKTDGTSGAEVFPSGSLYRQEGHELNVKVTAMPNGYKFAGWYLTSGNAFITNPENTETLIALNNEETVVEAFFQEVTSVGIRHKNEQSEIQMFYDRSLQKLRFSLPNTEKECTVGIYSLEGKKFKEAQLSKHEFAVPVRELLRGMYITRVMLENNMVKSFRFVKAN
jgi:hypothetical protein